MERAEESKSHTRGRRYPAPHDDLLWGAAAIAAYCGLTLRQTFYKLERGELPAGKSGNTWVASKARLDEHFAELTGATRPQCPAAPNED